MKLIHTADWHIGNIFYGYDRSDEHEAALAALADIAVAERPDVLLVSGDIFHNPRPSAAAQRIFTRAITRLLRTVPGMAIVVTAGNHDSASQHEVFRDAWRELGVYAVGSVGTDMGANFDKLIIELPGKCFVVAVPYCYGRALSDGLFDDLLAEVAERNTSGLPVLAMAHAAVQFGEVDTSKDYVGADEPVPVDSFGKGYDYLALGHIHRHAVVPRSGGRARYSGSVIPVNFDETYPHGVVCATLACHGAEPAVTFIPLPTIRPVVSLPTHDYLPWPQAFERLRKFDSATPSYVRLCISRDTPAPPDAAEQAEAVCAAAGHRFCTICYPPVDYHTDPSASRNLTVEEFRQMRPADVAALYCADADIDFDDELRALFDDVVADIDKNAHED